MASTVLFGVVASDVDYRTIGIGFVGAVLVFGGVIGFVGIGSVLDALGRARPPVLLAVVTVAAVWLTLWSFALRTVLAGLGTVVSVLTVVRVFVAATFANNVTPFGQAGGEPITALFISRATDAEYETGLAAIASVDALHVGPSLGLGLIGLGYYAATITLGRQLELVGAVVVGLAIGLPALGYLGWRTRHAIESTALRTALPLLRRAGRVLPRIPADPSALRTRIERFFTDVERVATDRRRLLVALGFSTLGWLALATSLWLSLFAIGYTVSLAAVALAIPIGKLAAVAPLPGGLGGVEALLIAALVPVTVVDAGAAGAAVIVHRTATYWLPTVIGGGSAAAIMTD